MAWFISTPQPGTLSTHRISQADKVLLVTSHPDDEVMFYTPFLLALQKRRTAVYILCLSNGNADGLGSQRASELYRACEALGVQADHVTVVNHPGLCDGMNTHWSPMLVSDIVVAHINTIKPDTVVTFDDFGVSGHCNHVHTHQGCLLAMSQLQLERDTSSSERSRGKKEQQPIRGYVLQSTSLYRKFLGPFDILFSLWGSEEELAVNLNLCRLFGAMAAHKSQLVWFRLLFLLFSRFSFINTFSEMLNSNAAPSTRARGRSSFSASADHDHISSVCASVG
jgi:N-acetylglucosaminylphosphatidylinositol deacetylase